MIAAMEKTEKEEFFGEMRRIAREETDRVLGVYTEYIDGKFKAVNERFEHLEKEIGGIKEALELHTEMLKDLSVDMLAVKSDIRIINAKLDRKADVKDLVMLDGRVTTLEDRCK